MVGASPSSSFDANTRVGEKQGHGYDETNDNKMTYDPDLAHPAAGYRDADTLELPTNVSESKLIRKIDLRVVPALSILYLL